MRETTCPRLVDPVMIAAFEGWNDAGEAASTALEHLELTLGRHPAGRRSTPRSTTTSRSRARTCGMADGVTRRIEWQTTRLSVAELPGTERHVVLVNGIEPNLRWRSFCAELLGHVERLGVTKVITLGALLTDTPHTRPTPVSGTSYDATSAGRAARRALQLPGPDRHRRGLPERLRRGRHPGHLVLGVRAALRLAGPRAEGGGGAAAPRRGGPRRRGAAGRAARAGRGVGAHRHARWPRPTTRCASTSASSRSRPRRRGRRRPVEGQRRRDRRRLRALPAPAGAGRGLSVS